MLQTAKQAYEQVNVAGRISRAWLTQGVLEQYADDYNHAARDRIVQRPRGPRPRWRQVADTFEDASQYALVAGFYALSESLNLSRCMVPPLVTGGTAWFSSLGGWTLQRHLYPIGELVLGRGHRYADFPAFATGDYIFDPVLRKHDCWSHYGVAGLLLEAAPKQCSAYFEQTGHHALSAACMYGAVLGRSLLQVPRLGVVACAALTEAPVAAVVAALVFSAYIFWEGVHAMLGSGPFAQGAELNGGLPERQNDLFALVDPPENDALDALGGLAAFVPEEAPIALREDNIDVDLGGPGINARVQERTTRLIKRLEPLLQVDNLDATAISEQFEHMAHDLRRFCSRERDHKALRGGLRLLKDFADLTFDEDDGVRFDPPELHLFAETPQAAA